MFTAFQGDKKIATLPLTELALALKHHDPSSALLIFNDQNGHAIDLDLRGSDAEILARLPISPEPVAIDDSAVVQETPEERSRGRPKLGVVAREVTLLPRHWDWLASQSGGASVALRKLVESARRDSLASEKTKAAQSAAYHFISAIAGNFAQFEEATRALFANDAERFVELIAQWPEDIRAHARQLGFPQNGESSHRDR
jgi:uncharacterized protein